MLQTETVPLSTKNERTKGTDGKSPVLGERRHEIKSIIEINEISENCPAGWINVSANKR